MWREARGNVMRKELDDLMVRVRNANESAMRTILHQINVTHSDTLEGYKLASDRQRKTLLKDCRKVASTMWDRGDWPFAIGTGIVCLNVESRFIPGDDAAYVKAETDKIIAEAMDPE